MNDNNNDHSIANTAPRTKTPPAGCPSTSIPLLSASRFAKRFPLLGPSLAGLSKFSHLISIDYFSDLMAALEEVVASPALPPAVRLRCLLTAAEILKGQVGRSTCVPWALFCCFV
jgi:hypothetical protein